MEDYKPQMTPEETEKLMAQLLSQAGDQSADSQSVAIVSADGKKKFIKQVTSEVTIGDDLVPKVSNDVVLYTLDCGHTVTDPNYIQILPDGYSVCHKHDLIICSVCNKTIGVADIGEHTVLSPTCKTCQIQELLIPVVYIIVIAFVIWLFV